MKKSISLLSLAILITICAILLPACNSINLPISIGNYANADQYLVGDQTYTGELTAIDIDWALGSVALKQDAEATDITICEQSENELDDDKKVHTYFENGKLHVKFWKSSLTSFVKAEDKQLTITYPCSLSELSLNIGSGSTKICNSEIETLNLNIASGDCEIESISGNSFKLNLASGKTTANTLTYNDVSINIASGKFLVDSIQCDNLKTKLASGNLNAEQVNATSLESDIASGSQTYKKCSAETASAKITSGTCKIYFDTLQSGSIKLSSGTVYFGVPQNGARFTVNKESGSFKPDTDTYTIDKGNYVFGDGGAIIDVTISSGTVHVVE